MKKNRGQHMREIRMQHGLTVAQISQQLDISEDEILAFENNEKFPLPSVLVYYEMYLGGCFEY